MPKTLDLIGQQFGRLTAIRKADSAPGKKLCWLCSCECGTQKIVRGNDLCTGNTKSCGCLSRENNNKPKKHGYASHPLYRIWRKMRHRCTNPENQAWKYYGGRGIKCLLPSPQALEDCIGPKPSPQHSVDRINNDGHYEAGNVRWAIPKEQSRNTRSNRILTWQGQSKCVAEWAEALGIKYVTLQSRLRVGWSIERTLSTPTLSRK